MRTFRELVAGWPGGVKAFARDAGIGFQAARKMRARNNIRHEHWPAVLRAARQRGIALTADGLVRMSNARNKTRRDTGRSPTSRAAA